MKVKSIGCADNETGKKLLLTRIKKSGLLRAT
jgi:hypothetical protein